MNHLQLFYVFRLEENRQALVRQQRGYYTISLLNQQSPVAGSRLLFQHAHALHAGESIPTQTGFSCMFNAAFLSAKMQQALQALPMFKKEADHSYELNSKQNNALRSLFEKMLEEVNNNYAFKYELLGNYLSEIIHHALKMQPVTI
jgi:AraC family transcriptional activator of pobA